jgi:hypothetical protein
MKIIMAIHFPSALKSEAFVTLQSAWGRAHAREGFDQFDT